MRKKKNILKRNSGFIAGCLLAAGASYFTADVAVTGGLQNFMMTGETEENLTEQADLPGALPPEQEKERILEMDPFTVTDSGNVIKGVEKELPVQSETDRDAEDSAENGDGEDSASDDGSYGTGDGGGNQDQSGDGSYDDGSYDDGSYDDGSYDGDDGGYYDDGSYDDGSYDGGYYDDGSYDDGSYDGGSYDDGSYDSGSYDNGYSDGYGGSEIEIQDPGGGSYTYDGYTDGGGDGSGDAGSDGGEDSAWTPSDVIIQGISSRYIDESELYNYDAGQLRLIRNEIFALNGRIFNSQDLMDYFSQKSWYVPTYPPEEFDANMFYYLNDYEEANLMVILNYEEALAGEV